MPEPEKRQSTPGCPHALAQALVRYPRHGVRLPDALPIERGDELVAVVRVDGIPVFPHDPDLEKTSGNILIILLPPMSRVSAIVQIFTRDAQPPSTVIHVFHNPSVGQGVHGSRAVSLYPDPSAGGRNASKAGKT